MKENRKNMKKENYVKVAIPKGKVAKWNDQGLLQLFDDKPKDVTERIKTFEDAVHELGENNTLVKEYKYYKDNNPINESNIDIVAYIKLRIVVAALNEGWKPQFNEDEKIWFPGFVFYTEDEFRIGTDEWKDDRALQLLLPANDLICGCSSQDSIWSDIEDADSSSVRLALKSETLASYCGKQFATLWAEHYTGKICKPWREVKKD